MAKSPIKRTLQRSLTLLNPTSTARSGAAGSPHALGGGRTRWAHLVERYPEVHDGLEHLAMVAAARGDHARAAEYYRKAADFVHDDSRPTATTAKWRFTCESRQPNSVRSASERSDGHAL
jgi:hypothetical protein